MVKFFFIILFLLLSSCDDNLPSMVSLDYYCPVKNLNICLDDFNNYELTWEYDISNQENCSGSAFKFLIYSSNDSSFDFSIQPTYLSINPEFDNMLDKYFLDENNIYHYKTDSFDNIGQHNYFTILVDYNLSNNQFSSDNPEVDLNLNVDGPIIEFNQNGCNVDLGYDSDCLAFNINHDALSCTSIKDTELHRLIYDKSSNELVEEKLVTFLNDQSITTDNIFLNLCSPNNNIIDIDQVFTIDIGLDYCSINPNTEYILKYFYKNEGVSSDTTTYPLDISFTRNNINLSSKALSSDDSRIYVDDDVNFSFYNQIIFYENDDDVLFSSPDHVIDLDETIMSGNIFNQTRVFDLESVNDNTYFVLFLGEYSYNFYDQLVNVETLDDQLSGFKLIENQNSNINNGNDFYMQIYEVTQSSLQIQGEIPMEANCDSAKNYILQFEDFIIRDQYEFSLPTIDEWEYAAGFNIFTNQFSEYPWGNEIDAYYANYLNSDLPSDSTGTVGVGLHNWPSSFGLFDMAGNVMEWTLDGNDECMAKGGNYLSSASDLLISRNHSQINEDSTLGIGFRIIMKEE